MVTRLFEPLAPRSLRLGGQELLAAEAMLECELSGTITHQKSVGRLFHYLARHGNGMDHILQSCNRAEIPTIVHDDGIQRDMSVAVGISAETDRVIARVCFRYPRTGLNRIEQ